MSENGGTSIAKPGKGNSSMNGVVKGLAGRLVPSACVTVTPGRRITQPPPATPSLSRLRLESTGGCIGCLLRPRLRSCQPIDLVRVRESRTPGKQWCIMRLFLERGNIVQRSAAVNTRGELRVGP